MDPPHSLRPVVASAAFVALAGLALWPPRAVYWTRLARVVGDGVTLAVVCLLALALGAVFARATGTRVRSFALGGVVAYVGGMAIIEAALTPDSPVHFVWYAALVGCLVVGAVFQERVSAAG
jgi:lipopolysaccharide export LptBFGC system permease protein LptF